MSLKNKPLVIGALALSGFMILLAALAVVLTPVQRSVSVSKSDLAFPAEMGGGMMADEEFTRSAMMDNAFAPEPSIGIFPPFSPTAGQNAAEVEQRIIKTGYLSLTVDSVEETATRISVISTERGGFVVDSSISEIGDGTQYGTVTIRVPVTAFESTLQELKALANVVTNESTSGQDVTEEYTDLEARLRNAKAQEETYLNILAKASSVEDTLAVQRELGYIRSEIESYEGRIKYLQNRTAYSTITATLTEEPRLNAPTREFRPLSSIREAAQSLVELGQAAVIGVIWVLIVGGGIGIPVGLIVLVIYLIMRARRGRK